MKKGKHPEEGAQRLNNLLSKHECFRKIFTIPEALAAARFLIKDEICLSQLILRMPLPNVEVLFETEKTIIHSRYLILVN